MLVELAHRREERRTCKPQRTGGPVVPAEDDTVLDADGARLFLDSSTTTLLDDKTLDVVTDPSGQVQFAVAEQPT